MLISAWLSVSSSRANPRWPITSGIGAGSPDLAHLEATLLEQPAQRIEGEQAGVR